MNDKLQELARACNGKGAREIQRICDEAGVSAIIRVFRGQCKGHTNDMPYVQSTYDTMNWGTLQTYIASRQEVGSKYGYTTVIINEGTRGDAHVPSTYWFVCVRDAESEVQ